MFASYTHVWDKDLIRKASSIKNVSDKDTLKYNSQKKYNLTKAGSIIKKKSKTLSSVFRSILLYQSKLAEFVHK